MRFSLLIQQLTLVVWCRPEDFDPFTECLVPDLNIACTDRCVEISVECITGCDPEDITCYSQCQREIAECINSCPCELNCLDGCEDCDNPVCNCEVVADNLDWNRCIDDNSLKLGRCVYACENNQDCEDDCLSRFKTRQLNCPCEENCSAGCPCNDFECTSTTPAPDVTTATVPATTPSPNRNAVLVLSTKHSNNQPMIVDFEGNINEDLTFEYGTEVYHGCGVTFQNEFWYFGGYESYQRQASKIVGCKFERQTDMPFNLYRGACNTFNKPNPVVLLCFDFTNSQECQIFDGNLYKPAGTSSYSHYDTFGMANYKGRALTTGCTSPSICMVKTELMDMNTLEWSFGPDYPFTSERITAYSTVSTTEAAYIIGGAYTQEIIAEFKNNNWRQFGTLSKLRYYNGSIKMGDEFMVIGGYSSHHSHLATEIWNFNNDSNRIIDPVLPENEYAFGIGLYIVPFDFCTD